VSLEQQENRLTAERGRAINEGGRRLRVVVMMREREVQGTDGRGFVKLSLANPLWDWLVAAAEAGGGH